MNVVESVNSVVEPSAEVLEEIFQLIEQNQMLSAWAKAPENLRKWPAGKAREVAAKLANGLGDARLGAVLHVLNARAFPDDFHYAFQKLFWDLAKKGSFFLLDDLDHWMAKRDTLTATQQSDLLSLAGWVHADLKDFDLGLKLTAEALEVDPHNSWAWVERSSVLEKNDQYPEALAAAQKAFSLKPGYRPAALQVANCLIHLGSDAEAEAFLTDCHQRFEHACYVGKLQSIYSEQENHEKALWCLNEYVRLSPLMPKEDLGWVTNRKADFALLDNDLQTGLNLLKQSKSVYQKAVAKNLEKDGAFNKKRVRLDVPFVRQHDMTCAPATLAALSKFWGKEHDHLQIADEICYDGTPWHKERQWMIDHGFVTREFRFTQSSLKAVIDREIPFTLTTSWTTGAHLQACIGYDDRLGIALLRDPTHRHFGEVLVDGLIEDHPVEGPHATLMVPQEKAELLDGLELPDSALYDALFELRKGLEATAEDTIKSAIGTIRAIDADHPLTHYAEIMVANYFGDQMKEVQHGLTLVKRFPKVPKLAYRIAHLVRATHSHDDYIHFLKKQLDQPHCDSIFEAEIGEALLQNVKDWPQAEKHLCKTLILRRQDSRSYASYARYFGLQGDHKTAAKLRKIASQMSPSHEPYASNYFYTTAQLGEMEEGLSFLRARVDAHGSKDAGPALTLSEAYESAHQEELAKRTLEDAIALHPEDGELLLIASLKFCGWGDSDKGRALLAQAKDKVPTALWHLKAAGIENFHAETEAAMQHFQQAAELQPSLINAHENYARLLAETDRDAALAYLTKQLEAHPTNLELLTSLAEWNSATAPKEAIKYLDKVLEQRPNDTWALRQKSIELRKLGKKDDALRLAGEALEKQSNQPESHAVLAELLEELNNTDLALSHYEQALHLNIDYTWAVDAYFKLSLAQNRPLEAISFLEKEMETQVTDGSIILSYRELTFKHLPAEALLKRLQRIASIRPDLWQSHVAISEQLIAMDKGEEALAYSQETTQKFPLTPRVWTALADCQKALNQRDAEIASLKTALSLAPSWDWLARRIAESCEWLGHIDQALDSLRSAVRWNPLNGANSGTLADLLWKIDRRDEAFEVLSSCLRKIANYGWGWSTLAQWSQVLGKDISPLLEKHRARRAHQAEWWQIECDVWYELGQPDKAIAQLDKAIAIAPKSAEFRNQKAYYLTLESRFAEAEETCQPEEFNGNIPRELLARQAWVRWQAGRHSEAKQMISKIVAQHPDYSWPHALYVDWLAETDDWENAKATAEQWSKIDPLYAVPWGRLGEANLALGHKQKAIDAFSKAHQLDPEYTYAANLLFNLYLEAKQLDNAEQTLEHIRHYQEHSVVAGCEARLAIEKKDKARMESLIRQLVIAETGNIETFREISNLMDKLKWKKHFYPVVKKLVEEGKANNSAAIEAWIWNQRFVMKIAKKLEALPYSAEMKTSAWSYIIDWAIELENNELAHKMAMRFPAFRENDYLWGRMAYFLYTSQQWRRTVQWTEDYQARTQVGTWAMCNRALAQIIERDFQGAITTAHHACHNMAPDSETTSNQALLATVCAVEDRLDITNAILDNPHNDLSDWDRSYTLIANLVQHAEDTQKCKRIWLEFVELQPQWKDLPVYHSLIKRARKTFRKKKAKWPVSLLKRMLTAKLNLPTVILLTIILVIVGVFGFAMLATAFGG